MTMTNLTKLARSAVFIAGASNGLTAPAANAAFVLSKDAFTEGRYCAMKFPAIRERTLATAQPVLKDPSSGDLIDFYGPCSHDPLGKEEVHDQLLQLQHRRTRDYTD
jgi:hypothetical protein